MIPVTRLNGSTIYVNSDLIEFLEATPDTIITLTTGRKIVSKDTVDEVIDKIVTFKRTFLTSLPEVKTSD